MTSIITQILKLSIITVNLNDAPGLRKTIERVVSQTFTDYEYIIIDGGSTDGSVEVIKEFADKITYWVSEPDKGIYNAMNKGIIRASGEYCLFLNSGDFLTNPTILNDCFRNEFNEDIVYGNIIYDRNGIHSIYKLPSSITFYIFYVDSIAHPSTFIKSDLFNKIGFYNENYKIISDWEFFLKAIFLRNASLKYIDLEISIYDCTGISMNSEDLCKIERSLVLKELFPKFITDYEKLNNYISSTTIIYSNNKYIEKLAKGLNYIISHKKNLLHK